MKRLLTAACAALSIWPAAAQQSATIAYSGSGQPPLMERQKEIALALSACPPFVAGKAGVYVLEKSGYVKARDGGNGFTAIVGHVFPNSVEPQCMSAEATRTHLPAILKLAELRAQGKSADEIKRTMAESAANGAFPKPSFGVDYMLSSQNLPPAFAGGVGPFPPHVMFFAPGATNADLGADVTVGPGGNPTAPAFIVNEGTPQAIIIVLAGGSGDAAASAQHSHIHGPE